MAPETASGWASLPRSPFYSLLSAPRAWLAAIIAVVAIVYARCLGNGFVFDDGDIIVNNRLLGQWSYIWRSFGHDLWWSLNPNHLPQSSFYRPFENLWLAVNFHLFGLNPAGWHTAAIALHLLAVGMAYRVASILSGDRWTGLLAAGLFGLMPIHAEAVVWPSAVAYPLCAIFELAAFELYLRGSAIPGAEHPGILALSMGLFGGALLSQDGAIVFPAIVAAHAFLIGPHRSYRTYKSYVAGGWLMDGAHAAIAAAWPYAAEAAAYLGLRLWVLGFIMGPNPNNHPLTVTEAALTIPAAIAAHAALLAIPWMAGPAHPLDVVRSIVAPGFYLPLAALIAAGAAGFLLLRHHPHRRLYLFCIAWISIALAPALNLRGLFAQALIDDRYLYLPSFGFCLIAADLAAAFATESERKAQAVWIGSAAVSIVYALVLFSIQPFWHDDYSLYTRCVEEAPGVSFWHYRLGVVLKARGDYARARAEFADARQLDPYAGGNVLYDLGLMDDRLGDPHAAAREMAAGLARLKNPPPGAYVQLALVAGRAGDSKAADAALARAADLPGGAEAAALGHAQLQLIHGDLKNAERALREILRRDPNDPQALLAIGTALSSEKRYEEALTPLRRAASLKPRAPLFHYLIAQSLHNLGRDREARDECAIALSLAPDDRGARALMGAIERGVGAAH